MKAEREQQQTMKTAMGTDGNRWNERGGQGWGGDEHKKVATRQFIDDIFVYCILTFFDATKHVLLKWRGKVRAGR